MGLPPASAVTVQPLLLAGTLLAAGVPLLLLVRVAPADTHRRARLASLAGGVLLLALVWFSPLQTVAQHYLLTAHLLQITVLMGAVPPLVLLALPRSPVRLPTLIAAPLRAVVHPLFAILAVNTAFFGWHITGPYVASMQSDTLYALQQLSLLVASLLFWWPITAPMGAHRSMSHLATMGYILLATIPQTFGGLAVALAHHVLYPPYAAAPRITSLDPLTDQQIAGACIALLSKIALFTAFTILFLRLLAAEDAQGDDGGGDDGGTWRRGAPRPAPSGTPRWLDDVRRGRTVPEPAMPRPVRVPAGSGSRRG